MTTIGRTLPLLGALAVAAAAAPAAAQKHPSFDDGGTLQWHQTLAAAKKAAAQSGRAIFVEYGREA